MPCNAFYPQSEVSWQLFYKTIAVQFQVLWGAGQLESTSIDYRRVGGGGGGGGVALPYRFATDITERKCMAHIHACTFY